jgi:hypothetical protein
MILEMSVAVVSSRKGLGQFNWLAIEAVVKNSQGASITLDNNHINLSET